MNSIRTQILGVATVMLAFVFATESHAQQVQRYQPSRPTVSPYLNLFRNNTGPLPNYYSLVRPQLHQQSFNQQQLYQQAGQQAALNSLQNQVQQGTTTITGKGSWFGVYRRQGFLTGGAGAGAGFGRR